MKKQQTVIAYFHSVNNPEYITRVEEYIRQKNYYQLLIGEWHKSIQDKDELCVSSCHSARKLAGKQQKMIKVCTNQLERLRKNKVEITNTSRTNNMGWGGMMKGMTEDTKVCTIHTARRSTL